MLLIHVCRMPVNPHSTFHCDEICQWQTGHIYHHVTIGLCRRRHRWWDSPLRGGLHTSWRGESCPKIDTELKILREQQDRSLGPRVEHSLEERHLRGPASSLHRWPSQTRSDLRDTETWQKISQKENDDIQTVTMLHFWEDRKGCRDDLGNLFLS